MRYVLTLLVLIGCAPGQMARGDDATAIARYEALAKEFSATVGNTNAELSAIDQRLKGVENKLGKIEKLLSVDTEISIEVPKAADVCVPPPVKSDATPIERADQRVTLHGKPLDVATVIKANYRVRWTHPGTIDSHLKEHDVAGFEGLDNDTKEKLHSALHEMGEAPKAVTKSKVVVKAPIVLPMASGGCPNGHCPLQQQGYYTSRSRLFGRR